MKWIIDRPVGFSIASALVLSAIYSVISQGNLALAAQLSAQISLLVLIVINIVFAIIAIVLLGVVNQSNGFKHVLATKGLGKGFVALLPVVPFIALHLTLNTGSMIESHSEIDAAIPLIALMRFSSAFVQSVLFRGLLITALFIKLSGEKTERVKSVFKAATLFFVFYIPFGIFSTGSIDLMNLINTFVVSVGFCAAYMYSKNLLSIILVTGTWYTLASVLAMPGVGINIEATALMLIPIIGILVFIMIFAIIFSRRAEPFKIRRFV